MSKVNFSTLHDIMSFITYVITGLIDLFEKIAKEKDNDDNKKENNDEH